MRRKTLLFTLWIMAGCLVALFPQNIDTFKGLVDKIEELYYAEKHDETITLIRNNLDTAENAVHEGALYWRLSRARFNATDISLYRGMEDEQAVEEFEEGIDLADTAISRLQSAKGNARGLSEALFWKAANMGQMGQVQGVLNSLFLADDMNDLLVRAISLSPGYPNSYYALGQLLEQLPGGIISFGDDDRAVNVGRKSISLHEEDLESNQVPYPFHDFYLELAKHLWARNWDTETRSAQRREKNSRLEETSDPMERAYLFEATIDLPLVRDREEAKNILRSTLRSLEDSDAPEIRARRDREKARELSRAWGLE